MNAFGLIGDPICSVGCRWYVVCTRSALTFEGRDDMMTLRVQFRLIAYHLSIVDRYPSLEQSSLEHGAA